MAFLADHNLKVLLDKANELVQAKVPPINVRELKGYNLHGTPEFHEVEHVLKFSIENGVNSVLRVTAYLGSSSIVSFQLSTYPACCAMYQLNYFTNGYGREITQDLVNTVMQCFFDAWQFMKDMDHGRSRNRWFRVLINFVEHDYTNNYDPLEDLSKHEPEKDSDVSYQLFYKWAKSQRKYQAMKLRNHNSSNIIHTAEVVIEAN